MVAPVLREDNYVLYLVLGKLPGYISYVTVTLMNSGQVVVKGSEMA